VNACYGDGATPLHAAAWHGDFEMVQLLLNYKVVDVDTRDRYEWTSMYDMSQGLCLIPNIYQSLPDVARLLLQHDADVNARILTTLVLAKPRCTSWSLYAFCSSVVQM
jgi:hypothetical protein